MNETVKKLLLNLYFIKQLIRQEKYENAKQLLENESGLEVEELIENHGDLSLEEATSKFTIELSSLEDENFDPIATSFTRFLSAIYYSLIDLQNDFVKKDDVLTNLDIFFVPSL